MKNLKDDAERILGFTIRTLGVLMMVVLVITIIATSEAVKRQDIDGKTRDAAISRISDRVDDIGRKIDEISRIKQQIKEQRQK